MSTRFAFAFGAAAVAAFSVVMLPGAVGAQSVESFYAGKQIRLAVGASIGGDYDTGGRLLVRYMGDYIPGKPTFVVQNMRGANGITAANFIYKVAPKDGTVIGTFSRNLPSQVVLGRASMDGDPRKFSWIGGVSLPSRVCVVAANSPVKSAEEIFQHEIIVGASGAGGALSIVPTVLNRVAGAKFKVVEGYTGVAEALLAMERGETQGICHSYGLFRNVHADLIRDNKVRVLFNVEEAQFADLPNVPSIFAYLKTEEQKQIVRFIFSSVEIGRPYVAPPDISAERLAALRAALTAALANPQLRAEAEKQDIDMTHRPASDLEALLDKLYATPPDLMTKVKEIMPESRD